MKKVLFAFIIISLSATVSIFAVSLLFKNQTDDRVLAAKEDPLEKLRCPNCNVILIGIDTLRADHLSSYGYFRDTSTNIDKFAERGVLFRNTFSASSRTTPSFMSIFTSLYPTDHGVINVLSADNTKVPIVKISDAVKTLPQILKDNGYKTYGMIASPQLAGELGFARGFDLFESGSKDSVLSLLPKIKSEKFFIFFHDAGPHDPYLPPFPFYSNYDVSPFGRSLVEKFNVNISQLSNTDWHDDDSLYVKSEKMRKYRKEYYELFWSGVDGNNQVHISDLISLYDGEIKYLDSFIGELQRVLKEQNLLQNTIIVFTADHGEEFYEHGKFVHDQLYNEILHVPLVIAWPKIDRKIEVAQTVRTVDIMPTILDLLSISAQKPLRGASLLPYILDPSRQEELSAVSVQDIKGVGKGLGYSFIYNNNKIIRKKSSIEFYDLVSDKEEKVNLAEREYDKLKELENSLDAVINDKRYIYEPIPIPLEIDENKRENLRSLGY